jgi:hypothetical protein
MSWFAVRCVFQTPQVEGFSYEERVTLWRADDFDRAIALAEAEAQAYEFGEYTGLAQAYLLLGEPGHGAEAFSLIRDSVLQAPAYLDRLFDTGTERQRPAR